MQRISKVALEKLGIAEDHLEPYGHYKAKLALEYLDTLKDRPDGKLILNCERYSNMSTYIWYGAMPFLRSGQIRGVDNDLAKEICSRQHDEGKSGSDGRGLKIESKKIYKGREGKSPDLSDSFFLLVELAKQRFRFRPSDTQADSTGPNGASRRPGGAWAAFCARCRANATYPGMRSKPR